MPIMHSDLAILNAEQYDDGVLAARGLRRAQPSPPSDDGPSTRKRAKKTQDDGTMEWKDSETAKKRMRGRPRLNTNDESAAERRRTQIRLAQRAYRNRKETTISTLEHQVKELKDTNEEMSNAFMALHDFALGSGLLDQAPGFATQLKSTTEKFLALARKSTDMGPGDDDAGPTADEDHTDGAPDKLRRATGADRGRSSKKSVSPEEAVDVQRHARGIASSTGSRESQHHRPQPQQLFGGLLLTHEPILESDLMSLPTTFPSLPGDTLGTTATVAGPTPNNDFEVITQPTFENASFPYPFTDEQLQAYLNPSPYPTITSPRSYAAMESTFGRRLHRTALERAITLISLPNPPPLRLVRVFGFCLPFESADRIRQRLEAALDRSNRESLSYWQYPYHNIGGAGTHFPTAPPHGGGGRGGRGSAADGSSSSSDEDGGTATRQLGSQGGVHDFRVHRNNNNNNNNGGTGFSTGPFTRPFSEMGNSRLDRRQRITVPGFEGDFYDPDEVELYLQRHGVAIGPGQDFVTLEVDLLRVFEEEQNPDVGAVGGGGASGGNSSSSTAAAHYPAVGPGLFPGPAIMGIVDDYTGASHAPPQTTTTTRGASAPMSPGESSQSESAGTLWTSTPPSGGATGASSGGNSNHANTGVDDMSDYMLPGSTPFTASGSLGSTQPMFPFAGIPMHGHDGGSGAHPRTVVTLDVNLFVSKLTDKATCLGRSPGFRIECIREAFLASVQRS